jgi:hypothetical protein
MATVLLLLPLLVLLSSVLVIPPSLSAYCTSLSTEKVSLLSPLTLTMAEESNEIKESLLLARVKETRRRLTADWLRKCKAARRDLWRSQRRAGNCKNCI